MMSVLHLQLRHCTHGVPVVTGNCSCCSTQVKHLSPEVRNAVGTRLLQLTLHELFHWRFMQTDPNWCQHCLTGLVCLLLVCKERDAGALQPRAWQMPSGGLLCRAFRAHSWACRGNFLYDEPTDMLHLIDFGASREYPADFVAVS
jgi:hypothetical protein